MRNHDVAKAHPHSNWQAPWAQGSIEHRRLDGSRSTSLSVAISATILGQHIALKPPLRSVLYSDAQDKISNSRSIQNRWYPKHSRQSNPLPTSFRPLFASPSQCSYSVESRLLRNERKAVLDPAERGYRQCEKKQVEPQRHR